MSLAGPVLILLGLALAGLLGSHRYRLPRRADRRLRGPEAGPTLTGSDRRHGDVTPSYTGVR
jgi:hypothetical protein